MRPARRAARLLWTHGAPLIAGAALAFGAAAWTQRATPFTPGDVAFWVADRDGREVIGLDRDLFVAARASVRHPVEIEARADGGAWVALAVEGDALGAHELVALDAKAAPLARWTVGPVLDLDCDGGDAWLLEDRNGEPTVLRVSIDGGLRTIGGVDGACAIAPRDPVLLVGAEDGRVVQLDAQTGATIGVRSLGGDVRDVAPAGSDGWWVLDSSGQGTLWRLEHDLSERWSTVVHLRSNRMAPVVGAERVWIADASVPLACRFGPAGELELSKFPLPLVGVDRGVADRGGGCVLAAPGALIRLDERGALQPGQGGFDFLVDVARVPE